MKSANTFIIFVFIVFSILLTSCSSSLKTNQNIDFGVSSQPDKVLYNMFPASIEGMKQFIINPSAEGKKLIIEFYAGKEQLVDCNRHRLSGDFLEKQVEGFGVSYYLFEGSGAVFSTKMGCPDYEKQIEFIASSSIRVIHNEKTPLVLYVPEGLEIRYSIWENTGSEQKALKQE